MPRRAATEHLATRSHREHAWAAVEDTAAAAAKLLVSCRVWTPKVCVAWRTST